MKKTILILSIITLIFAGCKKDDVFQKGDIFVNGWNSSITDGPVYPDEPAYPDAYLLKSVLLEDYTGVRCNNCPSAADLAIEIQEQSHHRVIVLNVYAGFLAQPIGGYPDFTTPEGTEWYSQFGFDSNPIGTVNRRLNGGSYAYSSSEWGDAVAETLQEAAVVEIIPSVEYNTATRNLNVNITSKFLAEMPDIYSLTVCIMEDSIVGKQLTPSGNDENYMHRHVFRGTMNGAWGEEINTTTIAPGDMITNSYTTTLGTAYNADRCYIIAYVSDCNTKEILQVIEKKIK